MNKFRKQTVHVWMDICKSYMRNHHCGSYLIAPGFLAILDSQVFLKEFLTCWMYPSKFGQSLDPENDFQNPQFLQILSHWHNLCRDEASGV